LDRNGSFQVPRHLVYGILPWLRSDDSVVRKAVLTLIAHAAAVDLPDWIDTHFPHEKGFADEFAEERFAVNALPTSLIAALTWTETCSQVPAHEVGVLLAWRLLLDLIHTDSNGRSTKSQIHTGSSDDEADEEDVSLRRIVVTFFRSDEGNILFREFLEHCVDIVVDGSDVERKAAAEAAQSALQIDKRPAQGLQLAQQQSETQNDIYCKGQTIGDDKMTAQIEHSMEVEVGQAAGIAFAS